MTSFDNMLTRLDPEEADVLRELDRRLAIAQALMQKVLPDLDVGPRDYGELLMKFFEPVDDFLDSVDDDEDDDEDDD
ncbi:MAG: hypothetical protein KDB80_06705 [Planctomycetes bacterium]|nr:hypothetical protein [Planctomycetota bacterium]